MNNKGVAIRYGDVAPEAKENFIPTASENKFDTLAQLQQYNLNFPNYANPCELYQTVLDGTATAFPSNPQDTNLGLWSEQISNDDGTFTDPIVLELQSANQYASQGLTLTFDTQNNIFATKLKIEWQRVSADGVTTLAEQEYTPDNAFYFCKKFVEYYNKIIITFYSINMPQNRLKLRVIDYGYGTFFYGNELRGVKLIQEIDPISTQISINTADFTLDSKTDMEYSFQAKQPLNVYFNGQLKATTFVKTANRQGKFLWKVQTEDYIGVMDSVTYYGGIYWGKDAYDLLVDIFTVAKVPYNINKQLQGVRLYGYIPFTTCREALMQVAFAVQNVVDTTNSEIVNVFALEENVKQNIPLNRIMQGQSFVDDDTVTSVEVVAHTYKPVTDPINVYDSEESGTGQNIFVKFSQPLHDLTITNGQIIESHTNYAIINANANCILKGQKYEHTTEARSKKNPLVLANDIEKIVSVENATLISQYNVDNVLEKCYNYFRKTKTIKAKIVEGKHVELGKTYRYGEAKYGKIKYGARKPTIITYDMPTNVGETIQTETEYLGVLSGMIIKQTFNLNGNTIIKDSIIK